MAANAGEEYMHLATMHGAEMAGRIAKFTLRNLERMKDLVEEYDAVEVSEVQRLQKLRVFLTAGKFSEFRESIGRMESDHPSLRGLYTILDKKTVLKVYKFQVLCFLASPLLTIILSNAGGLRRTLASMVRLAEH